MKGIMLKDLYDNFYIKKNLLSYIFAVGFIFVCLVLSHTTYSFILFAEILPCILGSAALESATEQDEKASFDRLQISFPVTKGEIILSKYLLALFFHAAANLISVCLMLAYVYIWGTVTLAQGIQVCLLSAGIALAFTALSYVFFFLLGKKAATVIYVILAVVIAMVYGSAASIYGLEEFLALDKRMPALILIPAAFVLYGLSCLLSIQIYKRKY